MTRTATKRKALTVMKKYVRKYLRGRVVRGDALAFLQSLKSDTASIVFLDPPFNLGKIYSRNHHVDDHDDWYYESWLEQVLVESVRILRPGGALYLYHIPLRAMRFGAFIDQHLDMNLRHWIAISMKNGFVRGLHLYPAHYALLYFTKGKPAHFKRPKISPSLCRHCGKLIKDYGGYRKYIEHEGINLSDFWEDLSPVRHAKFKRREANELPPRLLERVISVSGSPGELFVDPFAGTGSIVRLAVEAGMHFEACDIIHRNCALICQAVESTQVKHARK